MKLFSLWLGSFVLLSCADIEIGAFGVAVVVIVIVIVVVIVIDVAIGVGIVIVIVVGTSHIYGSSKLAQSPPLPP